MKQLLIIAIILTTHYFALAQKFNAKANAGFVASQIDGDKYGGYHKFGFSFGADVSQPIAKTDFSYRIGLRYVRKGSHAAEDEVTSFYKAELHYAEMPISALYTLRHFEFEAGVSVGYLIKSKEDTDGYGLKEPAYKFKQFELSALVGVNYNFYENIWVGVEFDYSLLPIRPYTTAHSEYLVSGEHNNLLIFKIAYLFHAAKK